MSIIERVAALLESTDQASREKLSTERKEPGEAAKHKPTLIERNVDAEVEQDRRHESGRPLSQPEAPHGTEKVEGSSSESPEPGTGEIAAVFRDRSSTVGARPRGTSAIVRIDRNHLRHQGIVEHDGLRSPVGECIRMVKSQLLHKTGKMEADQLQNLIMVTSSLTGEGKTFCAVNLAISIALERDRRVVLVDGDVANPTIPRVLGLDRSPGLMDHLMDPRIALGDLLLRTDIGNLEILQAGTWHEHATELLESEAMQDLVAMMAGPSSNSIVVFDSPPLLMASEASSLAHLVGQIVVVAAEGETRKSDLVDALGLIDQDKVAGLILNKGRGFKRRYGYGSYGSR